MKTITGKLTSKAKKIVTRVTSVLLATVIAGSATLALRAETVEAASQTEDFVRRLYQTSLNREADTDGLNFWVTSLENGSKTGADVAENFLLSQELTNRALSDGQFLDALYVSLMDRPSDAGGKTYWQGFLHSGCTRAGVLRRFLTSPEFTQICERYGIRRGDPQAKENRDVNLDLTAFVNRQYAEILGRPGDEGGLNHWTGAILNGQSIASVSEAFVFGDEFAPIRKNAVYFVDALYRAFMGRPSDEDGLLHWALQIAYGDKTRREVFTEFVFSQEFQNIVGSIGLSVGARPAAPYLGTDYERAISNGIVENINKFRNMNNVPSLRVSSALMHAGYIRAKELPSNLNSSRPGVAKEVGYDNLHYDEATGRITWNIALSRVSVAENVDKAIELINANGQALLSRDLVNVAAGTYCSGNMVYIIIIVGVPQWE